mmetsp:Transcript_27719/g.40159  ORF Transcript_27719/g.40159 Transcript_27719/m.40159 type:complete len:418 (-) Transcript_27719:157-1410(-)
MKRSFGEKDHRHGCFLARILPRPHSWPTIWVDFFSNVPFLALWSTYVFDYECICKRRDWSEGLVTRLFSPWPGTDYMGIVRESRFNTSIFIIWTLQVLATIGVVHFHLSRPHHPKFYVGRRNRIAIVCHIVGGSMADFGGYLGFVLGSEGLLRVSSFAGVMLHIPSALWQSRNLHGRREVMQPLYYFLDSFLLVKYLDVWFEQGSFASVIAMGYAVNMFALVRVYFRLFLSLGLEYGTSYDLVLILAVITNLPIVLGPMGCLQLVASLFIWNILLNILLPGSRSLLQVNRTVADVFPNTFKGKPINFAQELQKCLKTCEDERVAVATAAFHIIAGDNDTIELDEVEELLSGWGLPDAAAVAGQGFNDADENNDNVIDFHEFQRNLWFVWERIHVVGEAEVNQDGYVRPTKVQNLKVD